MEKQQDLGKGQPETPAQRVQNLVAKFGSVPIEEYRAEFDALPEELKPDARLLLSLTVLTPTVLSTGEPHAITSDGQVYKPK
ncbi:hypothetical protein ACFLZP_01270 [Patescibacteria group bacterium]